MRVNPSENVRARIALTALVILAGILAGTATSPPPKEWKEKKLTSNWREQGNAFIEIQDSRQVHTLRVRLFGEGEQRYPIPDEGDQAFFTAEELERQFGDITDWRYFRLLCGERRRERPFTTTAVFWSEDRWSGITKKVDCNAAVSHDMGGTLPVVRSICVVTDRTAPNRRDRCLLGPR